MLLELIIWFKFIALIVHRSLKWTNLLLSPLTLFKVVAEDNISKTYEFPKSLISIRSGTFKKIN